MTELRTYTGRVIEQNGRDVVVDMCSKRCDTCPNQASCQLLGPWREDLIDAGHLVVGSELLLWHPASQRVRYALLMYGWYLVALLALLVLCLWLIPSLILFLICLVPALYGAFRLQSRFFGTRLARKALQMQFRVL